MNGDGEEGLANAHAHSQLQETLTWGERRRNCLEAVWHPLVVGSVVFVS